MNEVVAVGAVTAVGLLGVVLANVLRRRGVPSALTRRVSAALAGVAFLIAVLSLEAGAAVALSGVLAAGILVVQWRFPQRLQGVRGESWDDRRAEIAFLAAATGSLAIGWLLLDNRWLAFLPIAFMAWGDNAAGLVRASVPSAHEPGIWPSLAMLAVGLVAALLFEPYWVGAVGAVVATVAERVQPITSRWWDDNWVVIATSITAMSILST